jgi:hypothetical protein
MLFILAMDPLQRLLDLATQQGIITPLPQVAAKWRTFMYVDDVAILIGSFTKFRRDLIWKAPTENKCKVFVWVLIHGKLLTADNLEKRGWPHEEHCVLCNGTLETGLHLCLCCPFAKVVWSQILSWEHFDGLLGQQQNDPPEII